VAKKKDSFDEWLESDAAQPPSEPRTHHGMTDAELSEAICRAAIKQGHDPAANGVIANAAVMGEEDSQELAYKNQLKANLALAISSHFGVNQRDAQAHLVATGTIPLGPDTCPVEQATLDLMVDSEEVQDLVFEGLQSKAVAVEEPDDDADLEAFANFVRRVEEYDTWLRPFAVFMGSLAISMALGLGGATTIFLMFLSYGFICGGFKSKQKAIAAKKPKVELPPCKRCGASRGNWMGISDATYSYCHTCRARDFGLNEANRPDGNPPRKTQLCDRCKHMANADGFQVLPFGPSQGKSNICKYCVPYVSGKIARSHLWPG